MINATRHRKPARGPISSVVSRLEPDELDRLDQAILEHAQLPDYKAYESFDLKSRGISMAAFYRYARRLRFHAALNDAELLAPPPGVNSVDLLCNYLDERMFELVDHDNPDFRELHRIALIRRQMTASELARIKSNESAQRLKQASIPAPAPPTTNAGHQPTMPNPASDANTPLPATPIPPLARGDQGGFEHDTTETAPATRTTNDAPQSPQAPTAPAPAPKRDPRFHVDLPPFQRKTPPGPPLPEKEFLRRNRANIRAGGYGLFTDGTPATREEFFEVLNRALKRVYNIELPEDYCVPFPLTEENRKLCQDYLDNWKDDIGKATPAPPPKLNRNPVPATHEAPLGVSPYATIDPPPDEAI